MKKSKFLKSSKEMLSRSFNPSKCKTSLRLASSRLKLLRNKKEVQVKQIRREISVLLESGQDQTARMRVEHVIREEKMMAAFDLIEIYCELIVARLPIIESQKICPIDLKEAVTSVVYASPRCGDVPELIDIKKHFTDKYGKDFITAAIELRPECGVSRILVEKLSAVAPDIQTKVKILNEIAKEHNVKWDGESIDQNYTPAGDLRTPPSNFVKESEPSMDTKVPKSNQLHDSSLNFSQVDNTPPRVSGVTIAFRDEVKPQGGERAELYRGDSYTNPHDRPRWNMDFKDATSAAQAAAESAEMASMAARAAAELSRRDSLTSHYSTESPRSLRDGARDTYMRSNMVGEQFSKDSTNRSVSEHSRLQSEHNSGERFEGGRDGRKEYSRSSSSESKASVYDDSMHHDVPVQYRYSQKNSLNEVSNGEKSVQSQSFKKANEKQESSVYSHSHSSISNNANIFGKEGIYEEASEKSYHGSAVVFDKSDSDSENDGFGISPTYDEPQQGFQSRLSTQKPHAYIPTESWSPRSSTSKTVKPSPSVFVTRKSSDIHERSTDGSKVDDSVSVAFDESDGQTSESEEEVQVSRDYLSERRQSVGLQLKDKSGPSFGSLHKGSPQFDQTLSSDSEYEETDSVRKQGRKFGADPPAKFNIGKPSADQPALVPKNRTEPNNIGNNSPEREEGLNFGKLRGGFRHKGYKYPSLGTNELDVSRHKKDFRETTDTFAKSTAKSDLQSTYIDSSSEDEEEDSLQKRSGHYTLRSGNDPKTKPSFRTSNSDFASDSALSSGKDLKTKPSFQTSNSVFGSNFTSDSDLEENLPKESHSRTHRLHSGFSQRTKASPSDHEKEKLSRMQLRSEALDVDYSMDREATTSTSSETPKRYETRRNSSKLGLEPPYDSHFIKEQKPTKSYSQLRNADLPSSSKLASKPTNGSLYQHSSDKTNPPRMQESEVSSKSYAREEASLPQRKTEASTKQENLKAETLNKTSSNKDFSNQKASHVHPKLPDYDDFLKFFQKNRP